MSREGAKGSRKPAVARHHDHVGELGLLGIFWVFLGSQTILFFMGACVSGFAMKILSILFMHRTRNQRSHMRFKKIFPEIFLTLYNIFRIFS